jgi:dihydrofolate synthase/folylpolyglutamate synthase
MKYTMNPMSYKDTIADLYKLQQFSIKQGLENILKLTQQLGNPHNEYPVIHIAGTNGKGSTSALIQRIFSEHGFSCGLYTSPHLVDFRERIRINNEMIDPEYICKYWYDMAEVVSSEKATFFDTTTALAFSYFRDKKVDIAVIETGLGGRLDSTNIVQSVAAVLTPIHRDHTKQLGKRLSAIAREKADIIRRGSAVFCAKQHNRVLLALTEYHSLIRQWYYLPEVTKIHYIPENSSNSFFDLKDLIRSVTYENLELNLAGKHQIENASLAYLVSRWFLEQNNIHFDEFLFRRALKTVYWPGRFQKISGNPDIILDVSHNYDGFRKTSELIKYQYPDRKVHLLIGLLADKEYRQIAKKICKLFASITITNPVHERVLQPEKLQSYLKSLDTEATIIKDYRKAWMKLTSKLSADEVLIVMGSHFLVGAILATIQEKLDFIS